MRVLAGVIVFLFAAADGWAQELNARALVDSTQYLIGDWITVRIELTHPPGMALQPMVGDTLGEFTVIERYPVEVISESESRMMLVVAKYDSGTFILPAVPFATSTAADSAHRVALTNPLVLTIHTVPIDSAGDIRDIKSPMAVSMTLAEILLYVALCLALLAGAWYGYRYWQKRRQVPTPALIRPTPPSRPAHVIALEKLNALLEKKLWQQGLIKEYYSELTDIVRDYIELRYKLRALEQTTDETLLSLHVYSLPEGSMEILEEVLRRADLAKFAKYHPDIAEHERSMTLSREFVLKTKPGAPLVSHQEHRAA